MGLPMNEALQNALLLLVALQVKHVVCDGPLQTLDMVRDKSVYGRPKGLLHGLVHALGCALVFAFWGLPLYLVATLALLDGIIHYHIDFSKENIVKRLGWTHSDGPFWWAIITDQTLHHMTAILLVWLALKP
jgi:Protein of unknown function (DUF3307)